MSHHKHGKNAIVIQGSILAIASIISRMIGIIYRIPLVKILGDEGMGLYSMAFEIYVLILLISSYSLPMAVSKLVSQTNLRKEYRNSYKILKTTLLVAFITGGLFSFFVFIFASQIAQSFISNPLGGYALRALAPAIVVVSIVGVLRGFFQGLGTMVPTAVSQIIEQITNGIVSVGAAYYLYQVGQKLGDMKRGVAYGAMGGTMGTTTGAMMSLIFLGFLWFAFRYVNQKRLRYNGGIVEISKREILSMLMVTAVPIILNTAVMNILNVVDLKLFNHFLKGQLEVGTTTSSLWGIYSSKYRLLINFPISLADAMTASLVPGLIISYVQRDKGAVYEKMEAAIRFIFILLIPASIGLASIGMPVVDLLLKDDRKLLVYMFLMGSWAIGFTGFSTLSSGIFQGINKNRVPVLNALKALVIHIILLCVLLGVFKLNIYGLVIGEACFGLTTFLFNYHSVRKYTGYRIDWKMAVMMPLFCSLIMGIVTFVSEKGIYLLLGRRSISVLVSLFLGGVTYMILLIKTKTLVREEILDFPKGEKIVHLLERCHLLL